MCIYVGLAVVNTYAALRVDYWARNRISRRGVVMKHLARTATNKAADKSGSSGSDNSNSTSDKSKGMSLS